MKPLVLSALIPLPALACEICSPSVHARVFNDEFLLTFAVLLLPLAIMLGAIWMIRSALEARRQ